jgi:hypothetical protein
MKQLILSFVCILLIAVLPASGEQKKEHGSLYEIKRDGKIGFIKWGFIDRTGRFVWGPAKN